MPAKAIILMFMVVSFCVVCVPQSNKSLKLHLQAPTILPQSKTKTLQEAAKDYFPIHKKAQP
jgi:flagellar assembly factor FliW